MNQVGEANPTTLKPTFPVKEMGLDQPHIVGVHKKHKRKDKKKKRGKKHRFQKNRLPDEKLNVVRYTLIYYDDVLNDLMNVKREVMYCKPQNDGGNAYYEVDSNIMDNEYFKQKLRTNKGIFFNLNVQPSSPRKIRSPQLSQKNLYRDRGDIDTLSRCEYNQSVAGADKGSVYGFQNANESNYSGYKFAGRGAGQTDNESMVGAKIQPQSSRCINESNKSTNRKKRKDSGSFSLEIESGSDSDSDDSSSDDNRKNQKNIVVNKNELSMQKNQTLNAKCSEIRLFDGIKQSVSEFTKNKQDAKRKMSVVAPMAFADIEKVRKQLQIDQASCNGNNGRILECDSDQFNSKDSSRSSRLSPLRIKLKNNQKSTNLLQQNLAILMNSSQISQSPTTIQNQIENEKGKFSPTNNNLVSTSYPQTVDKDDDADIDQYQRLRELEDYLFANFRSPTKQEIKRVVRQREIDQIDTQIKNKHEKYPEDESPYLRNFQDESSPIFKMNTSLNKEALFLDQNMLPNENVKVQSGFNSERAQQKSDLSQQLKEGFNINKFGMVNQQFGKDIQTDSRNNKQQTNQIQIQKKEQFGTFQQIDKADIEEDIFDNQTDARARSNTMINNFKQKMRPRIQLQCKADPQVQYDESIQIRPNDQQNIAEVSDRSGSVNHHPLWGKNITFKEPNSATGQAFGEFKSQFKHLGKQNGLGTLKNQLIKNNRKISEYSGQSIASDDSESYDSEFVTSESDSNNSSGIDCECNTPKNRFDEFMNMQDQKKSIFTRKIDNKKLLMLQNKIEFNHNELQQMGGVTQRDIEQLTKTTQVRDLAERNPDHFNQHFENAIIVQQQENLNIQTNSLLKHQMAGTHTTITAYRRKSELLNFQVRNDRDRNQLDSAFGIVEIGGNKLQRNQANLNKFDNLGTMTSKSNGPPQQMQPKSVIKKSNYQKSNMSNNLKKSDNATNSDIATANNDINNQAIRSHNVSINKTSIRDTRKKSFRISKINKKERRKQVNRLQYSTAKNEDDDFLENQKNKLQWLQKLSENIRGVAALNAANNNPRSQTDQIQTNSQIETQGGGVGITATDIIGQAIAQSQEGFNQNTQQQIGQFFNDRSSVLKIQTPNINKNYDLKLIANQKQAKLKRRFRKRYKSETNISTVSIQTKQLIKRNFSLKVFQNNESGLSDQPDQEDFSIKNLFNKNQENLAAAKNCPSMQEIQINNIQSDLLQKTENSFREEHSIISESSDEIRQIQSNLNKQNIGQGTYASYMMKQASPTFGINMQAEFNVSKPSKQVKQVSMQIQGFGQQSKHDFIPKDKLNEQPKQAPLHIQQKIPNQNNVNSNEINYDQNQKQNSQDKNCLNKQKSNQRKNNNQISSDQKIKNQQISQEHLEIKGFQKVHKIRQNIDKTNSQNESQYNNVINKNKYDKLNQNDATLTKNFMKNLQKIDNDLSKRKMKPVGIAQSNLQPIINEANLKGIQKQTTKAQPQQIVSSSPKRNQLNKSKQQLLIQQNIERSNYIRNLNSMLDSKINKKKKEKVSKPVTSKQQERNSTIWDWELNNHEISFSPKHGNELIHKTSIDSKNKIDNEIKQRNRLDSQDSRQLITSKVQPKQKQLKKVKSKSIAQPNNSPIPNDLIEHAHRKSSHDSSLSNKQNYLNHQFINTKLNHSNLNFDDNSNQISNVIKPGLSLKATNVNFYSNYQFDKNQLSPHRLIFTSSNISNQSPNHQLSQQDSTNNDFMNLKTSPQGNQSLRILDSFQNDENNLKNCMLKSQAIQGAIMQKKTKSPQNKKQNGFNLLNHSPQNKHQIQFKTKLIPMNFDQQSEPKSKLSINQPSKNSQQVSANNSNYVLTNFVNQKPDQNSVGPDYNRQQILKKLQTVQSQIQSSSGHQYTDSYNQNVQKLQNSQPIAKRFNNMSLKLDTYNAQNQKWDKEIFSGTNFNRKKPTFFNIKEGSPITPNPLKHKVSPKKSLNESAEKIRRLQRLMDEQERNQNMGLVNSDAGSGNSQTGYGNFYQGQGGPKHQQIRPINHQIAQQQTNHIWQARHSVGVLNSEQATMQMQQNESVIANSPTSPKKLRKYQYQSIEIDQWGQSTVKLISHKKSQIGSVIPLQYCATSQLDTLLDESNDKKQFKVNQNKNFNDRNTDLYLQKQMMTENWRREINDDLDDLSRFFQKKKKYSTQSKQNIKQEKNAHQPNLRKQL